MKVSPEERGGPSTLAWHTADRAAAAAPVPLSRGQRRIRGDPSNGGLLGPARSAAGRGADAGHGRLIRHNPPPRVRPNRAGSQQRIAAACLQRRRGQRGARPAAARAGRGRMAGPPRAPGSNGTDRDGARVNAGSEINVDAPPLMPPPRHRPGRRSWNRARAGSRRNAERKGRALKTGGAASSKMVRAGGDRRGGGAST
jgi:hypothetical protein